MEEFNNLYGDDVFPRTEMDEGTFNVMDREKIIKFLKKPVLTT